MKTYVLVYYGMVMEVITTNRDINTLYHPDFVQYLIEVTGMEPMPDQWWAYDGQNFYPPT
jgi:hypothetical protein